MRTRWFAGGPAVRGTARALLAGTLVLGSIGSCNLPKPQIPSIGMAPSGPAATFAGHPAIRRAALAGEAPGRAIARSAAGPARTVAGSIAGRAAPAVNASDRVPGVRA